MNPIIKVFNQYNAASANCLKKSRWWLNLMVIVNFFVPLVLIFTVEAQITVLCALIGLGIGLVIFKIDGYRRLLSLMHLPWVFLVIFLWGRLDDFPWASLQGFWLRSVIVINSISLAIDGKDLIYYFFGKKEYPKD